MVDGTFDNVYTRNLRPIVSGDLFINGVAGAAVRTIAAGGRQALSVAFDNWAVTTYNNTLDNGSGNMIVTGQMQLPLAGSSGGLVIGSDTNLYRDSANVLKTDSSLLVASNLTSYGSTTCNNFVKIAGANPYLNLYYTGVGEWHFGPIVPSDATLYWDFYGTKMKLGIDGNLTLTGKLAINCNSQSLPTNNYGPVISWNYTTEGETNFFNTYYSSYVTTAFSWYQCTSAAVATKLMSINPAGSLAVTGNVANGGFDFVLGTADQTSRGNTGASRALVKDTGGVLAINYANDFYGGVQVRSKLSSLNNVLDDGSGNASWINCNTFKDTGKSLLWHWSGEWGYTTVENYRSPSSDPNACVNIFCSIVTPLDHSMTMNPHLYVDRGIFVEDDVMTFGAFMTSSDPQKGGVGGGAIQMGHGFERSDDPPRINLTDDEFHTLYITAGSSVDVGADAVLADLKVKDLIAGGPGWANVSLAHDGSHGYVTAHTGDLVLCANTGIVRTGTINPASGQHTGKVGDHTGAYWGEISGYDIWGHTSHLLDAYDDLALVKQWGEKNPKLLNYDTAKVAPPGDDIFAMLRLDHEGKVSPNKDMFNFGQLANFALGCAKALAKKQDEYEVQFEALLSQVEELRTQIQQLNRVNSAAS